MKRNFMLGLLFTVVFLLLSLLRGSSETLPAQSTMGGRYQIVINPNVRADTFMIDTQTGRTWSPVRFVDKVDEPRGWMVIPRFDSDLEALAWEKMQRNKPTATTEVK